MKKAEVNEVIKRLKQGQEGLYIAYDMDLSAYEVCMIEEAWKVVDQLEKRNGMLQAKFRYIMIGAYMLTEGIGVTEVAIIMGVTARTAHNWKFDRKSMEWLSGFRKMEYQGVEGL